MGIFARGQRGAVVRQFFHLHRPVVTHAVACIGASGHRGLRTPPPHRHHGQQQQRHAQQQPGAQAPGLPLAAPRRRLAAVILEGERRCRGRLGREHAADHRLAQLFELLQARLGEVTDPRLHVFCQLPPAICIRITLGIAWAGAGQGLAVGICLDPQHRGSGRLIHAGADTQQHRQPFGRGQDLQVRRRLGPVPTCRRCQQLRGAAQQAPETGGPIGHLQVGGVAGEGAHGHGHHALGQGGIAGLQFSHYQSAAFDAPQEGRQRIGCGRGKGGGCGRHVNSIIPGMIPSASLAADACTWPSRGAVRRLQQVVHSVNTL
ncbi:hypothetical protein D3C81_1211160 [compost metagenome]